MGDLKVALQRYKGYLLTAMSFVEAQCINYGVKRNQR